MTMGIIYAILSSVFFGIYIVPKKLTKIHPTVYTVFMGLSFFIAALTSYFIKSRSAVGVETLFDTLMLFAILEGILWSLGSIFFLTAIDKIGITKSNQWKNLQGPIGVILSLIVLSEYQTTNPYITGIAGIAIFISALFFNIAKNKQEKSLNKHGIIWALLSGVFFGLVAVINKYLTNESGIYAQQVFWSLSIFTTALIIVLIRNQQLNQLLKPKRNDLLLGFAGGLLYFGASFFMLKAFDLIEASVAFTIIQLNALWAITIGILVFKEISLRRHWVRITLGLVFTIVSILLLTLAKK